MNRELAQTGMAGLAGLAWALLCIVVFVGFDGELSVVVAMLAFLFAYASIMLWRTICSSTMAPLALMFWLFHANFLFLPALAQASHRSFFWSSFDGYSQESLLYACAIMVAGLVAFRFGSGLGQARVRNLGSNSAVRHFLARPLRATWVIQLCLVTVMLFLVGVVALMGPDFFMVLRQDRLLPDTQAQTGLLLNLPRGLALGVLLFTVCYLVQGWHINRKFNAPMLVILAAALVLNAIINYPLGLARFWFFGLLISLIWIVTPLHTVKLRSAFVLAITTLQFTLFPWYSQLTRGTGLLGFDLAAIRRYLHHGDFDGFQAITNGLIYIGDSGFEHGRNLLSVVLFFVPRTFWNKAEPLGASAAEHMGYAFTNLSAPIYGELYVDFGLLSLLVGMAVIGYVLKLMDAWYHQLVRQNRFGTGVLLTSVLAGYMVILLRGSLLAVISSIATLFALFFLLMLLGGRARSRRRRGSVAFGATANPLAGS